MSYYSRRIADWDVAKVRYFVLDYDSGNDRNVGFVDDDPGTTFAPGVLDAVALKTIEHLVQAVLPHEGAGRMAVVLMKTRASGANYLAPDGVTESSLDLSAIDGGSYACFLWRGSTDLTNSATDRVECGHMVAHAGPNGDTSFTVGASPTTSVINFASGTVPASPAARQYRIRFASNTTTAALRGVCRNIARHTTTQVTLGLVLPAVPAGTDTFFIEKPGAAVVNLVARGGADQQSGAAPSLGTLIGVPGFAPRVQIVGLRCTGTADLSLGTLGLSFVELASAATTFDFAARSMHSLTADATYLDEAGNARAPGTGLRTQCPIFLHQIGVVMGTACGIVAGAGLFGGGVLSEVRAGEFGRRSYIKGGINLYGSGNPFAESASSVRQPGYCLLLGTNAASASETSMDIEDVNFAFQEGAVAAIQSTFRAERIAFTNSNGGACIVIRGSCGGAISIDGCTGSTGNSSYGLMVLNPGSRLNAGITILMGLGSTNTFTGSLGDIETADACVLTHTSLTTTNVPDTFGNNFIGTGGVVMPPGTFHFVNDEATALALGEIVRISVAGHVVRAKADTSAHVDGPLYVALTEPAAAANGLFAPIGHPQKWVLHDAAPTLNALSYVSEATAGLASNTVPPAAATNQKRRIGHVVKISGSLGLLAGSPELLQVTSDGLP